jgi:hypothetical protein
MSWAELKNVIGRTPAPPCNGCPQSKRCATQKMSCLDFARYVTQQSWRGSSNRNASRSLYDRMFWVPDDER